MKKIIFFGTGRDAEQMLLEIEARNSFYEDRVVAFTDNDPSKWGKKYHGHPIIMPSEIQSSDYDKIIITSSNYYQEIKDSLINLYEIENDKITFWRDYLIEINIFFQYQRSIKRNANRENKSPLDSTHTVIYTAIENDYDELPQPLYVGPDVDYVCFTDNRSIKSDIWHIEYIQTSADRNYARDIRKYKFFPENYFKEYNTSIWIDANLHIRKDLNELISSYSMGSSLLCFPHTARKCIYEECGTLIELRKASPTDLIRQSADYIQSGFPADHGLYSGGVLIRNHQDELLHKCMTDWWDEINIHTLRDQMSLPYVLWKNGLEPDLCNLNIDSCQYLKYNRHKMGHWRTAR